MQDRKLQIKCKTLQFQVDAKEVYIFLHQEMKVRNMMGYFAEEGENVARSFYELEKEKFS